MDGRIPATNTIRCVTGVGRSGLVALGVAFPEVAGQGHVGRKWRQSGNANAPELIAFTEDFRKAMLGPAANAVARLAPARSEDRAHTGPGFS